MRDQVQKDRAITVRRSEATSQLESRASRFEIHLLQYRMHVGAVLMYPLKITNSSLRTQTPFYSTLAPVLTPRPSIYLEELKTHSNNNLSNPAIPVTFSFLAR